MTEKTNTRVLIEYYEGGLPWGVYNIMYYTLRAGRVTQNEGCDMNVGAGYVARCAAKLKPNEALIATCESQHGGGMRAYGSAAMGVAMKAANT